tara:strand:+ start:964 stop:1389 length:426 start_codon:yes stop_codon:yes gene_type:complete
MLISKEFKNQIKKQIIDYYKKKLETTKLEPKTLGFLIRSFHVNLPIYILIFLIYGSKLYSQFLIFSLFLSLFLFVLFDGCLISMIEQSIDGVNITIMDPFLEAYNMEKINKNRLTISLIIGPLFILLSFFIYYLRFIRNRG